MAYRLLLALLAPLFLLSAYGQSARPSSAPYGQETLAKFIITDARMNKVNITESYLNSGGYIVFYAFNNRPPLYLANVMAKVNTQSWGKIIITDVSELKKTYDSYPADVVEFRWYYANSYDSKEGTAQAQFIKVYKPQGVYFVLSMVLENLDTIVYKGFMEGSLDFSQYK